MIALRYDEIDRIIGVIVLAAAPNARTAAIEFAFLCFLGLTQITGYLPFGDHFAPCGVK
jgi:hypothetical protein